MDFLGIFRDFFSDFKRFPLDFVGIFGIFKNISEGFLGFQRDIWRFLRDFSFGF